MRDRRETKLNASRRILRLVVVVSATLFFGTARPVLCKELWQLNWIEVRSPHFVVVSALPEARTTELVVDLENFRTAAEMLTNIGRFEERIPTHIYVLPYEVPELRLDGKIVGYFLPGMRANYAAVMPSPVKLDAVLKHEYMHFLVHNRDKLAYPTWFDEGFAELLSTLHVRFAALEYGNTLEQRIYSLEYESWMPFTKVLDARGTASLSHAQMPMFYAQSWLLLHYLMIGRPGTNTSAELQTFLRLRESGLASVPAFEQAFSLKVSTLQSTLRYYGSKMRYFKATLLQPYPPVQSTKHEVSPDRVAAELGTLALHHGNYAAAQHFYDYALSAKPANAMALVGMGDVLKNAKRYAEADANYQKAIALEPTNPLHQLDYAEYFLTLAQEEKIPERAHELFIEARRHLARSYALDANNPETLAENGLTYLLEKVSPDKAVQSLELAYELLPSQSEIRHLLARAYIANHELDKARPHLQALIAWAETTNAMTLQEELNGLDAVPSAPTKQTMHEFACEHCRAGLIPNKRPN